MLLRPQASGCCRLPPSASVYWPVQRARCCSELRFEIRLHCLVSLGISFLLSSGGLKKKVPVHNTSSYLPTATGNGGKTQNEGSGYTLPSPCDLQLGALLVGVLSWLNGEHIPFFAGAQQTFILLQCTERVFRKQVQGLCCWVHSK